MKKISIITLIFCAIICFCGCKEETLSFEKVNSLIKDGKTPYLIETTIEYKKGDLELNSNSSLAIEKSGETYKAKYMYSKQKLNDIGNQNTERVTTETDTKYYNGSQIGSVSGSSVVWELGSFEAFDISPLTLKEEYFNNIKFKSENSLNEFSAKINESDVDKLLDEVDDAENFVIVISYTTEIKSLILTYSYSDQATIKITVNYSFENQQIVMPD